MFYLNSDGGARGNPGPAAVGIVIRNLQEEVVASKGAYIGEATNNVAEYAALIKGLEVLLDMKAEEVVCRLDSELVVKQLKGEYRVKDATLQKYFAKVVALRQKFGKVEFKHVPRTQNKQADKIVNEILDARENEQHQK